MATRKTAVLRITRPGTTDDEIPLDSERSYAFELRVDGQPATGGEFVPGLGDEKWSWYIQALNRATSADEDEARKAQGPLRTVRDVGRKFYDHLTRLAPALMAFLMTERGPRRLVIESANGEIHKLPWEAIVRPDWTIPADSDLSIVHTTPLFRADPRVCQAPLRVARVFGPRTPLATNEALTSIQSAASGRIHVDGWQTGNATDVPDADIYHIEAHGSRDTGAVEIEYELKSTTPLANRLRGRPMVLLWTCYSALQRSWKTSAAYLLNELENSLVLAFQTELHIDTAAWLAADFYRNLFANREIADPETAFVHARSMLYKDRLNSCEWAALTVWLRQPVDVTAALLDGPRVPAESWSGNAIGSADEQLLELVLRDEAFAGRPLLLAGANISAPLPSALVAAYRGTIVHLDGDLRHGTQLANVVKAIVPDSTFVHPADGLLSVIGELGREPESLLLWTGVNETVQRACGLIAIPPSLRVVLTSPHSLPMADGIFHSPRSIANSLPPSPAAEMPLDHLERIERSGRYREAYALWESHRSTVSGWPVADQIRFWIVGYWIGARLEDELSNLETIIGELTPIAPFEAALVHGNLRSRAGHDDQARRHYMEAQRLATTDTERARVGIEMAYLALLLGDVPLADAHYRAAIRLLESVTDGDLDPRWRSALGRGLRDFAHLLARDKTRAAEARARVNRAIAIHAFDGRLSQLAASLTTRGRIDRTMERWDDGERALIQAVGLQHEGGNVLGWAAAVQDLTELQLEAGRYALALELVTRVFERLDNSGDSLQNSAAGMAAYACARASWRLGRFAETREWTDRALDRLPAARREERVALERLKGVARSMSPDVEPSGG
ncbi:MAG TPA: hypothetical protein VH740_12305 [Vicinamibacterales bacterium]